VDGLFDWYWLGVALGLGIGAGIAGPHREGGRTLGVVVVALAAVGAGVIAALATGWGAIAALVGVAIGVFSFRHLSPAAAPAAALAAGVLALVPALGYLEAVAAPVLGQRLSRRAGQRYAGLRILARD
jgi:hypothetical protein